MKARLGFVSNSSSSSFIIDKAALSGIQIKIIENIKAVVEAIIGEEGKKMMNDDGTYNGWYLEALNDWTIEDYGKVFKCSTPMDNFDLQAFLLNAGIPYCAISDD